MKNIYSDLEAIVRLYKEDHLVHAYDDSSVEPDRNLIKLFEQFLSTYSNIPPTYWESADTGILLTSNRIISTGDPAKPTKFIVTDEDNTYSFSIANSKLSSSSSKWHSITILKDRNLVLYQIMESIYVSNITYKYQTTIYSLRRLSELFLSFGYFPVFDPLYIAIFPLKFVTGAQIVDFLRFMIPCKSLEIDTHQVKWLPLFITHTDNADVINVNTIEQILDASPPRNINVELDEYFIELLGTQREAHPELTPILLQLTL